MSLGSSFGLGFYLGLSFNDMCPIIPFLLLGIGVDDIFVIVHCLDEVQDKDISIEEKIARAVKSAGVSITVTSITDAGAFFIGATTVGFQRGTFYKKQDQRPIAAHSLK